jgi:cation:H+ antiporter
MAVTNVVGSNIFNLLLILGVTGLIQPIRVHPGIVSLDMWVMIGIAVLLFPLVIRDAELSRRDGLLFLGAYLAYIGYVGLG